MQRRGGSRRSRADASARPSRRTRAQTVLHPLEDDQRQCRPAVASPIGHSVLESKRNLYEYVPGYFRPAV